MTNGGEVPAGNELWGTADERIIYLNGPGWWFSENSVIPPPATNVRTMYHGTGARLPRKGSRRNVEMGLSTLLRRLNDCGCVNHRLSLESWEKRICIGYQRWRTVEMGLVPY